ncbi:hypothetical protein CULT_1280018 [[Clostridium] ultunense Esp]|nr:hypothetical protein CULT_1280018 [[Clostridium] ultunense Esp]
MKAIQLLLLFSLILNVLLFILVIHYETTKEGISYRILYNEIYNVYDLYQMILEQLDIEANREQYKYKTVEENIPYYGLLIDINRTTNKINYLSTLAGELQINSLFGYFTVPKTTVLNQIQQDILSSMLKKEPLKVTEEAKEKIKAESKRQIKPTYNLHRLREIILQKE